MGKTIKYSVVPRINPQSPRSGYKYYGQSQANGVVTLKEMAQRIEESTTCTYTDAIAVLTALENRIRESLANGEIVQLGEIGNLQINVVNKSGGSETEEDYTAASNIVGAKIRFRPGAGIRSVLYGLNFEKVPMKSSSVADGTAKYSPNNPDNQEGGGDNQGGE